MDNVAIFKRKKVHPFFRGKLDSLTDEQRALLCQWLIVEEISYHEAKRRVKEQFGLSVATGTLAKFWQRVCLKSVLQREQLQHDIVVEVVVRQGQTVLATKTVQVLSPRLPSES